MSKLVIGVGAEAPGRAGDLGARVEGGRLLLPAEIVERLGRLSIRSGEELLSYLATFPSAVASALGWQAEEVEEARRKLLRTVSGSVEDRLLEDGPPFERGFGAFHPSSGGRTPEDSS